jgi:autotransporter translocation and assembly factor TamB
MKKGKKHRHPVRHTIMFALFLFLGIILWFAFHPQLWYPLPLRYLNENVLHDSGWQIKLASLSGNANSGLYAEQLKIQNYDSSIVIIIDTLDTKYGTIFSLLRRNISEITIHQPKIYIHQTHNEKLTDADAENEISLPPFRSDKIILKNGFLRYETMDTAYTIENLQLSGRYSTWRERSAIQIDKASLFWQEKALFIENIRSILTLRDGQYSLNKLDLDIGNERYHLSGYFFPEKPEPIGLTLNLETFHPARWYDSQWLSPSDSVNANLTLKGNPDHFSVVGQIWAGWEKGEDFSAEIDLSRAKDSLIIRELQLKTEVGTGKLQGWLTMGLDYSMNAELANLSLSSFAPIELRRVSGQFNANGKAADSITADWQFAAEDFYGEAINSITGKAVYANKQLILTEPINIKSSGLEARLIGELDSLQNCAFQLLVNGKPQSAFLDSLGFSADTVRIAARISGPVQSPKLTLNSTLGGINYPGMEINSLHALFTAEDILKNPQGDWYIRGSGLSLAQYPLNKIWAAGSLSGQRLEISSISAENDRDRYELSAQILHYNEILVSAFAADIGQNRIRLSKPFDIISLSSGGAVSPALFTLNDGNLSLLMSWTPKLEIDADLQLSNIAAGDFFRNIAKEAPLDGRLNANILFSGALNNPAFSVDALFKSGHFTDFAFEELVIKSAYENGKLNIEELDALLAEEAYARLTGRFPMLLNFQEEPNFRYVPGDSIFLNISTYGLWLKPLLSKLDMPIDLNGKVASFTQLSGTYGAPRLAADLNIDSVKVDTLKFDNLAGRILYGNEQLQLQDIKIRGEDLAYNGSGFLPLNLSLLPVEERIPQDKRLLLSLQGNDKNLAYLSPYLTFLESIEGDFYTEFEMTGTMEKPVRNGLVELRNGRIVLQDVDNPISAIDADFTLSKNLMDVKVSANMTQDNFSVAEELTRRKKSSGKKNLNVNGSIDLNELLNPKYDLTVKANELFYSDLTGNIKVVTDVDLKVTGQEALAIRGTLPVDEGLLQFEFQDFGGPTNPDPGLMILDIAIPIRQNTYLKNSLLDVELNGDLFLSKQSNRPMSIGGELNLASGSFYYYSGNFTIQDGVLIFDPVQDKININIEAWTYVENRSNRIFATVSGDLDRLQIQLRDEKGIYNTQKDLIQLLTTGYVPNIASSGALSTTATNVVGIALEKEMERTASRLTGFERVDLQTSGSLLESGNLDSMSILLGRRLGKNVFVTYERTLSAENPKQAVELEYRLNRNISIIGAADEESVSASIRLRYQY